MQKSLLALLALATLTGCGIAPMPAPGTAVFSRGLAARSADPDKHAIAPPAPLPVRQGFNPGDVQAIAKAAYAQAYSAPTSAAAQADATLALQKIQAIAPGSTLATQVVPYVESLMQTKVGDDQDARRLALWPLLYISQGLASTGDPTFFELAGKTMQSMLNFNDGLAVGLATVNQLTGSSNGYVQTMAEKVVADYKNPQNDLKASYNDILSTLQQIDTTLAAIKH